MIETVLCVDIGTTSLKAGLITADGEVVSFSSRRFANFRDRFIARFWLDALRKAIKKLLENTDAKICGIVVSGNGPTVVSSSGMTLRWNEKIHLDKKSDSANLPDFGFSLFLPRIYAFKQLFSKDYENARYLFSGPEFLIFKLCDKAVTILPEKRFLSAYWTYAQLLSLDLDCEKLPGYVDIGQICGGLTKNAAAFLGLEEGIPVISGGPDFVVALIGTNTLEPGKLCDRCGSSEGFNFCIPQRIEWEGVRTLPSVIAGLWNASVLIPNSSRLEESKRIERAGIAVDILKKLANNYNISFPSEIVITGGQAKNKAVMEKKAKAIGVKLAESQCPDGELLGDACAGWFALGRYDSIKAAANSIVKLNVVYENL